MKKTMPRLLPILVQLCHVTHSKIVLQVKKRKSTKKMQKKKVAKKMWKIKATKNDLIKGHLKDNINLGQEEMCTQEKSTSHVDKNKPMSIKKTTISQRFCRCFNKNCSRVKI